MTAILAKEMETRGRHATGVARLSRGDRIKITKAPVSATAFLRTHRGIGDGVRAALIHTRYYTQGDPRNNLNNHPIQYENIVGIHNGMVDNDHELFRAMEWDRFGEVDSEIIFAAIKHLGELKGLEIVEGLIACAWFDANHPGHLYLARHTSSPLWVFSADSGSVVFASTRQAVEKAVKATPMKGLIFQMNEGQLLEFYEDVEGGIGRWEDSFTLPDRFKSNSLDDHHWSEWEGWGHGVTPGIWQKDGEGRWYQRSADGDGFIRRGAPKTLALLPPADPTPKEVAAEEADPFGLTHFTTQLGTLVEEDMVVAFLPHDREFPAILGQFICLRGNDSNLALVAMFIDGENTIANAWVKVDQLFAEEEFYNKVEPWLRDGSDSVEGLIDADRVVQAYIESLPQNARRGQGETVDADSWEDDPWEYQVAGA